MDSDDTMRICLMCRKRKVDNSDEKAVLIASTVMHLILFAIEFLLSAKIGIKSISQGDALKNHFFFKTAFLISGLAINTLIG